MSDICFEISDRVAVATFDRPRVLNAFRISMVEELLAILERAREDDGIRALVLTGNGRGFCAGEDLRELRELIEGSESLEEAVTSHLPLFQEITRRLVSLPKPVLAAINGVAVGLGAELAVACDIRIASETATLGFTEVKRGLFETNGVTYLLPRLVGRGRALELLLGGERIDAAEALRIGLVNRVVPPGELMEEALDRARGLAANAPLPIRLLKEALAEDLDLEQALELETRGVRACLASDDLREGLDSFLESRPPEFRGR